MKEKHIKTLSAFKTSALLGFIYCAISLWVIFLYPNYSFEYIPLIVLLIVVFIFERFVYHNFTKNEKK